jgi:exosortase/archaeosortase family protein
MIGSIKEQYHKIPVEGRKFITRALFLFIAWKLLYNFILVPINIPDRQLTWLVGNGTSAFLSLFYDSTGFEEMNAIFINGVRTIKIMPFCNGLELIVLFLGFLLCLPATKKRFWAYALAGIAGINILNILRCSGLAYMKLNHHLLTNFAHHYAFNIAVYAFVFYLWVLYAKKSRLYAL